jgi:carotenoid cleavage dioxygenase
VASNNFHPFFPNVDGTPFSIDGVSPTIRRWTFDLASGRDDWQEEILFDGFRGTSMVRIDDRYMGQAFRYSYMLVVDPELPFDRERGGNLSVRVANSIRRFDHLTGAVDRLSAGTTHGLSEPQFVPRSPDAPEGDGYVLTVANNFAEMRSELVIADAQRLGEGPVARVKLPFRLHTQVHGWWEPTGGFAPP